MSKVVLYGSIIGVVYMFYKTYKRTETRQINQSDE